MEHRWEEGDHRLHSSAAARVFSPRNWAHAVILRNKEQSVAIFNYTTTDFQLIWCQSLQEQFPALQKFSLKIIPMSYLSKDVNSHKNKWRICSNTKRARALSSPLGTWLLPVCPIQKVCRLQQTTQRHMQ